MNQNPTWLLCCEHFVIKTEFIFNHFSTVDFFPKSISCQFLKATSVTELIPSPLQKLGWCCVPEMQFSNKNLVLVYSSSKKFHIKAKYIANSLWTKYP